MSSPSFKIRPAQIRDLPRITTVCLAGLPDDPTFGFLWRYAREYPDDNYFFWLQRFKDDLYDPKKTFLVAVESASDRHKDEERGEARETIAAFAVWELNGTVSHIPHLISPLLCGGSWNVLHSK